MYLYLLCLLVYPIFGQVISSPTIETLIEKGEGQFWLVLDLDNTVFEGKEAFGHTFWFDDQYAKERSKGLTKPEAVAKLYPTWIESQKVNQVQPVEEKLIDWIHQLQEQGVTVFGLTARQDVLSPYTDRQLASIGVDFSLTAPKGTFHSPQSNPVKYENGIVYGHDLNDKGAVLAAFLEENKFHPQKILFIDDKLYNVESVEKMLKAKEIDVIALHYTALQEREPVYHPAIAKFQQEKLHRLLSNDEALLLLHHQPDIHQ